MKNKKKFLRKLMKTANEIRPNSPQITFELRVKLKKIATKHWTNFSKFHSM